MDFLRFTLLEITRLKVGVSFLMIHKKNLAFKLIKNLYLQQHQKREETLDEIQKTLEQEINLQFNGLFGLPHHYLFSSLNQEAEMVEWFDLSKKLNDFKLFNGHLFIKIIENKGDFDEKRVKSELSEFLTLGKFNNFFLTKSFTNQGKAIGINTEEIELIRDEELIEYRSDLLRVVRNRLKDEQNLNSVQDNLAAFEAIYCPWLEIEPSNLEFKKSQTDHSKSLTDKLKLKPKTHIDITVFDVGPHMSFEYYEMSVPLANTAKQVIESYVKLKSNKKSELDMVNKESIVLNVCGYDEVLYNNKNRLSSYKVSITIKIQILEKFKKKIDSK